MFLSQLADQHNVKVSVNDIVIKAVALALKNVPEVNGKILNIPSFIMFLYLSWKFAYFMGCTWWAANLIILNIDKHDNCLFRVATS